ncbi:hypothetical protein A4A49_59026 [Nicotiana attenuata]|uniref:Uncharacterized protein n=1 Tax=Nicotiana attenuata TaxID=49451 RepID=A0A314L6H3_NICAT|nr:hypothetical protein A4A49_59026 [Nicotiana attenuata]
MAKFLASLFYVVLIVAIASDERFVPVVYGEQCTVDVGFNICSSLNDRCRKICIQAIFYPVDQATCQIRSDGSTFCECIFACHKKTNLKIATSPAPY